MKYCAPRLFVVGLLATLVAAAPSGAANTIARQGELKLASAPPARFQQPVRRRLTRVRPNTCSGQGQFSFVGGSGSRNFPNVAGGVASGILSGLNNYACGSASGVAVGESNETDGGFDFIGGGLNNFTGGGGTNGIVVGQNNTNQGKFGFIGAGDSNSMSSSSGASSSGGVDSAVVAGEYNTVNGSKLNTGNFSIIGAGQQNTLTGQWAAIVAGFSNTLSGDYAFIGGGSTNAASGRNAVVPGGYSNVAKGIGSFAAGRGANALHDGAFVWGDQSVAPVVKSTAPNQFVVRASGGVTFYSSKGLTTGVNLAAGSGSWSSLSDRAVKTAVEPVDDAAILAKVAALPVNVWSYTAQGTGVRHVGPMAQDFRAAFGVGEDDRHIATIDESGVALAAIKGLEARTSREITTLRYRLARDDASLARQDAEIAALRDDLGRLASKLKAPSRQ